MSDKSKLRWKCRRGMLELDVLLERFLDNHYDHLSSIQKASFEQFIDYQDDELFGFLLKGIKSKDPQINELIKIMLQQ